jgi:hypothetical protein
LDITSPESPEGLATLVFHFNSINMASGQDGNKKPMFISDVQIVNGPNGEIPSQGFIASSMNLKRFGEANVYLSLREASFRLSMVSRREIWPNHRLQREPTFRSFGAKHSPERN